MFDSVGLLRHLVMTQPTAEILETMSGNDNNKIVQLMWENITDNVIDTMSVILLIIKYNVDVNAIIKGKRLIEFLFYKEAFGCISVLLLSNRLDKTVDYQLGNCTEPLSYKDFLKTLLAIAKQATLPDISEVKRDILISSVVIAEKYQLLNLPNAELVKRGNKLLIEHNTELTKHVRNKNVTSDLYALLGLLSRQYNSETLH